MNFFGKKSSKKEKEPAPQYKPFDFSAPDAFSEENMAKVMSASNHLSGELRTEAMCTSSIGLPFLCVW